MLSFNIQLVSQCYYNTKKGEIQAVHEKLLRVVSLPTDEGVTFGCVYNPSVTRSRATSLYTREAFLQTHLRWRSDFISVHPNKKNTLKTFFESF